jgi:peptidylprolyl isomerase
MRDMLRRAHDFSIPPMAASGNGSAASLSNWLSPRRIDRAPFRARQRRICIMQMTDCYWEDEERLSLQAHRRAALESRRDTAPTKDRPMPDTAQRGDRVLVQCLRLCERAPNEVPRRHQTLEFTVGSREVIAGLSTGVVGMSPGDVKQLQISVRDGFGAVRRRLIRTVPRQRFPDDMELYIGKRLTATGMKSGRRRRVTVIEVHPNAVIVDSNHPLAGKVLQVEVQLLALDSFSAAHPKPESNANHSRKSTGDAH